MTKHTRITGDGKGAPGWEGLARQQSRWIYELLRLVILSVTVALLDRLL